MSYDSVLSQVCDRTYKMLELAQNRQWDELAEEERCRSTILKNLGMHKVESGTEEFVENKLREIVEVNQLITFLCAQEKNSCLNEFKQVKTSKKAAAAYTRY